MYYKSCTISSIRKFIIVMLYKEKSCCFSNEANKLIISFIRFSSCFFYNTKTIQKFYYCREFPSADDYCASNQIKHIFRI